MGLQDDRKVNKTEGNAATHIEVGELDGACALFNLPEERRNELIHSDRSICDRIGVILASVVNIEVFSIVELSKLHFVDGLPVSHAPSI